MRQFRLPMRSLPNWNSKTQSGVCRGFAPALFYAFLGLT